MPKLKRFLTLFCKKTWDLTSQVLILYFTTINILPQSFNTLIKFLQKKKTFSRYFRNLLWETDKKSLVASFKASKL